MFSDNDVYLCFCVVFFLVSKKTNHVHDIYILFYTFKRCSVQEVAIAIFDTRYFFFFFSLIQDSKNLHEHEVALARAGPIYRASNAVTTWPREMNEVKLVLPSPCRVFRDQLEVVS